MRVVRSIAGGACCDCEGRGRVERLDTMLVGEQAPGSWVLASRGVAVRVLSADEAAQVNAALDALERALAGEGHFDARFADPIEQERDVPLSSEGPR
jgi:hydrogenase expression/formation protein HypC